MRAIADSARVVGLRSILLDAVDHQLKQQLGLPSQSCEQNVHSLRRIETAQKTDAQRLVLTRMRAVRPCVGAVPDQPDLASSDAIDEQQLLRPVSQCDDASAR